MRSVVATRGLLRPETPVGPFDGPRYVYDGFCFGCGEPKPATHNTWTPVGLLCIGCRGGDHGVSFERGIMGMPDFFLWHCGGCLAYGPEAGAKTFMQAHRGLRRHEPKCPNPRVVLREAGLGR